MPQSTAVRSGRVPTEFHDARGPIIRAREAVAGAAADARARLLDDERRVAAADAVDSAIGLWARLLQAQRDLIISLVETVPVPGTNGSRVPVISDSVYAVYEVAGRMLEAQRRALRAVVGVN